MPRRDGIDVAKYQGTINWSQVSSAGVFWAFYKATLGTTTVDPFFALNRMGARVQGFRHRGVYHWLTPTAAGPQVDHFFATIGKLQPGEGVMLDAEQAGISAALAAEWCDRVEHVTQLPVAVYTGLYVADLWHSSRLFNGTRARILAFYGSESSMQARVISDGGGHQPDGWQWIGTGGTCPGVAGSVDCNQIYSPGVFDRVCGTAIAPPPPPPPSPAQEDFMYVRLDLPGSIAVFEAGAGQVFWLQDGHEQPANTTVYPQPATYFKKRYLVGDLPVGDTGKTWSLADFKSPIPIIGPRGPVGPQGVQGVPGPVGPPGPAGELTTGTVLVVQ